jgi:hypothetical protein
MFLQTATLMKRRGRNTNRNIITIKESQAAAENFTHVVPASGSGFACAGHISPHLQFVKPTMTMLNT